MLGLNDIIIKRKKVRNGLYAYLTQSSVKIGDQSYIGYSLTDAISKFRRDFPAYK
jgi:hypothetical protein